MSPAPMSRLLCPLLSCPHVPYHVPTPMFLCSHLTWCSSICCLTAGRSPPMGPALCISSSFCLLHVISSCSSTSSCAHCSVLDSSRLLKRVKFMRIESNRSTPSEEDRHNDRIQLTITSLTSSQSRAPNKGT